MVLKVDLVADLDAEDDDGLGWSTLGDATDVVRPWGSNPEPADLRVGCRSYPEDAASR